MTRLRMVAVLAALLFSTHALLADVRSEQKTHVEFAGMLGRMVNIFGGKAAREGVISSVAVKGDRKATLNDTTGQIIDLSEEKVYDLDLRKKSYKVTTFDELRRRMEEAQKKAEENARKEQGKSAPPQQNEKQMEIDVDIRNTGEMKIINGFNTHEAILTITMREKGKSLDESGGMVMTTDMWLAPKIVAMKEIVDFDMRYAQKLYGGMLAGVSAEQMAAAMAMYPMMKQMMGRMSAEGGKVDGTPILTTMTMDSVKSQDQMADEARQQQQSDSDSKPGLGGGVGGLLGGLAKKAAAKKAQGDDSGPKQRSTVMTSTTEVLKVATEVGANDVAIPAGFKENK
jgi:hypothetical protein